MDDSNQPDVADRRPGGEAPDPLPTMVDLDRLAAELDHVDATLAALDREVTSPQAPGGHPDPAIDPSS